MYCIWIVTPAGYKHTDSFMEQALPLRDAFAELGYDVPIVRSPEEVIGVPVILAAHLLSFTEVPHNAIIYNLEQIVIPSAWITENYLTILKNHTVWDYSPANIESLKKYGIHASLCELGYMPCLTRIDPGEEDIDVLFYGSVNTRRQIILNSLLKFGVNVKILFGVYGKERDDCIARSKIVLNMHYYPSKVFEVTRCLFLMANKKCIVSELGKDPTIENRYSDGIAFCDYYQLVGTCLYLLRHKDERNGLSQKGFDLVTQRTQTQFLKEVL